MKTTIITTIIHDDYRTQAQDLVAELNNTTTRLQYLTQQLIDMVPLLVATEKLQLLPE
jgi:hypothetical protein